MPTQTRAPNLDYAVAGTWTGVAGNRFSLVADYPDTAGANYLAHGTTAGNLAFGFAPFTIPANAFAISVQVQYYDAEPSNGVNNLASRLRIGGVYYPAVSHNPAGTTYTARSDNWSVNPRTLAAWTVDDVNGIGANPLQHFGLVSTDANPVARISCIQIQVTYRVGDFTPIAAAYTVVDNTYFHTPKDVLEDRIEVEIGDRTKPTVFSPHVMIRRWNDEVNFSIGLSDPNLSPVVANHSGVIEWKSSSGNARFYGVQADSQSEDGGIEFEVLLASKPPINYLALPVQTKNVTWCYQPPLTDEWHVGDMGGKVASVTESEVRDASNGLLMYRPPNIVGSYAIYHSATPANVQGGKLYRAGKVAHIFRPKAIDAAGTWAWCSLSYNGSDTLTLVCPQAFLDAAIYPVIIDPTFGYTTKGATGKVDNGDNIFGCRFQLTENASDITGISIYTKGQAGNIKTAVFSDASNLLNNVTRLGQSAGTTRQTDGWTNTSLATGAVSAAWLWLLFDYDNQITYYIDTNASYKMAWDAYNYTSAFPTPYTTSGGYDASRIVSIYATYTAAAGGLPIPVARPYTQAVNRAGTY